METTSRVDTDGAPSTDTAEAEGVRTARRAVVVDGYRRATFPWYALDEAFTGPRRLTPVGRAADGTVQHGAIGHGDEPLARPDAGPEKERFAVVVTVASSPVRGSGDGTGTLEATTVSTAAWLAGSGLLACTWPPQLDHTLRDDWLDQQTEIAFELADELEEAPWSTLSLPVDGVPVEFHYRESEFGWVLAGSAKGVHIGAYGRGMSAYGLGFSAVEDVADYA
ncbi:hypothetical protein OG233_10195 [Streptomyces sp. NBC_01218]|uniref:hypothetical protein n=1 Tax=unclassified Streptomyces TaxID=2593676 RepID=UPI0023B99F92|nr:MULTISPECIES: hypothetical protein [unclassified Streptomyces]WEH39828.1 hypothetical protein PZB77_10025 [Streptomyces sp. AM 2-1-1]WSQ51520.1 hypothetical protein OG233_10195 [Streptomyces sp. NBC_01218]